MVILNLYNPSHLITRSHEEHKEKDVFRFVITEILCGFVALCEISKLRPGALGCFNTLKKSLISFY